MRRFRVAPAVAAALLAMTTGSGCTRGTPAGPAPTSTAPPRTAPPGTATFQNPIRAKKGADPWITYFDGNYYLIATSWESSLTMQKSSTLAGLATAPDVTVWSDRTASRCCNMWAPEIHRFNGRWYLYYTAGQGIRDYFPTQRLHAAESEGDDPMGPYRYKNRLHDPAADTAFIDGSIVTLNGRLYLMGSVLGQPQVLAMMAMTNPYTVTGRRSTIATPTEGWERQGGAVAEAPVALQHNGKTFIVYSASMCSTPDYKLGLLTYTGGDPLAGRSWTKSRSPVFARSDANHVFGPGHNGFFKSPDGSEDWIVYHANNSASGACDNNRSTRAQRFTWNADGTPNFGTPVALSTPLPSPSGERRP